MYCVKFLDRLRGKFGNFDDPTDDADLTNQILHTEAKRRQGKLSRALAIRPAAAGSAQYPVDLAGD